MNKAKLNDFDKNWNYEMRREIQEIIQNLYIGPYFHSKNPDILTSKGITTIVCVRDRLERNIIKSCYPSYLNCIEIDIKDDSTDMVIPQFFYCNQIIEECLRLSGGILVTCSGGINRSPAFIVAYLMAHKKFTFNTAYSLVQSKRLCVQLNYGLKQALIEYEPIVAASSAIYVGYGPRGVRRCREDESDDEKEDKIHKRSEFED
jgi:serine/threonine/tyrosine-interacting protein